MAATADIKPILSSLSALPVRLWKENPNGLVSLWDMLQNYLPFYEISHELGAQRRYADLNASFGDNHKIDSTNATEFKDLLGRIEGQCKEFGLDRAGNLASKALSRSLPQRSGELVRELDFFDDVLTGELAAESLFRIPPDRKDYFESNELFGAEVGLAFPSCAVDIRKAGSCYALDQADACVHHLMMVLERGLNALAGKLGVPYQRTNWQNIIETVASKLKPMPKGNEKDFYLEVNSQFGFLKDAYRNHSEHARDEHYDLGKALSTLTHVRSFMQELAKRGLAE